MATTANYSANNFCWNRQQHFANSNCSCRVTQSSYRVTQNRTSQHFANTNCSCHSSQNRTDTSRLVALPRDSGTAQYAAINQQCAVRHTATAAAALRFKSFGAAARKLLSLEAISFCYVMDLQTNDPLIRMTDT